MDKRKKNLQKTMAAAEMKPGTVKSAEKKSETVTMTEKKSEDIASDDHTIEAVIKDFADQEEHGDVVNDGVEELLIEKYMLLREKSQAFLKIYPKLIRGGFISIFVIPLIFMILMFTVNSKLVFLTLWIISIISICGYLIGVEYFYFYYLNVHEEFERARHPEKFSESEQNIEQDSEQNPESVDEEGIDIDDFDYDIDEEFLDEGETDEEDI